MLGLGLGIVIPSSLSRLTILRRSIGMSDMSCTNIMTIPTLERKGRVRVIGSGSGSGSGSRSRLGLGILVIG